MVAVEELSALSEEEGGPDQQVRVQVVGHMGFATVRITCPSTGFMFSPNGEGGGSVIMATSPQARAAFILESWTVVRIEKIAARTPKAA